MAGYLGRSVAFLWNGAIIAGIREKGVSVNGAPINVTSAEDAGWQTLLTEAGENSVDISLAGVVKDERLKADWFAGTRTRACSLTYPNGAVISGNFYLANFKDGNPYNNAATFDATLQSTGVVTYTPGS